MSREEPRLEVIFETGEVAVVDLSGKFLERIRFVVLEPDSGYADVADFIRAALRAEVDRAEKGLYGRRRKW